MHVFIPSGGGSRPDETTATGFLVNQMVPIPARTATSRAGQMGTAPDDTEITAIMKGPPITEAFFFARFSAEG